jgi:hypothetical protein
LLRFYSMLLGNVKIRFGVRRVLVRRAVARNM